MSSTLTIDGTDYDQSGRRSANYLVDGWGWDLDADFWCEFHEHTSGPQPILAGPVPVSLAVGGTTVFTGDMMSCVPAIGPDGRTWAYRALGLAYRANWLPVVAIDDSGTIRFNTSPTDVLNYDPSFAGQSVGDILGYCLAQHASALSAAGITTDATTTSQLAAQTLVPQDEVIVSGERLWSALQSVLARYARNIRLLILPTAAGAGVVRLVDVTAGTGHTLTVGTDPVEPPLFARSWTSTATRVVVRGRGIIEPAYVSQLKGTLTPAWDSTAQAAWNWQSFINPTDANDAGTVVSVDSPTQVTVSSSNAALTWAVNKWSGLQAWIYLIYSSGSGLTYTEARPITANSALTAGGTATITLGYDLSNSGAGAYDSYKIVGTNPAPADGGLADVWRLYDVTDPGGWIADHLVRSFPVPVPFITYFGNAAAMTTTPCGQVLGPTGVGTFQASSGFFQVLPRTGQILFYRPVVELFNTLDNLETGGSSVTAPTDVYCLLAYSRGALSTPYPADSGGSPTYSGTAYSAAGLQRSQFVDVDSWQYQGNTTVMNALATMLQVSVRDTVMEGTVRYNGYYSTVQDPTAGNGHLLSFAGNSYTTGDESLSIPVRAVTYRYHNEGGGLTYTTEMRCSTRRDPRTGESQYMHLSHLGSGAHPFAVPDTGFGAGDAGSIERSERYQEESKRLTKESTQKGGGFTGNIVGADAGMRGFGSDAKVSGAGGPNFQGQTGFSLDASDYQGQAPDITFGDDTRAPRRRTRLLDSNQRQYAAAEHDRRDVAAREAAGKTADEQNAAVRLTTRAGGMTSDEVYRRDEERDNTERLARRDNARRRRTLTRAPRPGELVYGGQATGSPRTGTDLEPGEQMAGSGGEGPAGGRTAADRYLNGEGDA